MKKGNGKAMEKIVETSLRRHGYLPVRFLGEGAFSTVYLVRNGRGQSLACKVSENIGLLHREAELMKRLAHPLFTEFVEFWQDISGYLIMEYAAGSTLEETLERRGGFSAECVTRAGIELALGLGCMHEQCGMAYRDLKPANMILCQNGKMKLIDLGCACALGEVPSAKAGSPGFAAPEQMRKEGKITAACDVYGLGKTLEAMLGMRAAKCGGLKRLILCCTREEAEKRLPDMRSAAAALAQMLRKEGGCKEKAGWEKDILQGSLEIQKNILKIGQPSRVTETAVC